MLGCRQSRGLQAVAALNPGQRLFWEMLLVLLLLTPPLSLRMIFSKTIVSSLMKRKKLLI